MIQEKTVLILGAGASMDFGCPPGHEIVQLVHGVLWNAKNNPQHPLRACDFGENAITEFAKALWDSDMLSVDAFLEHQPRYLHLGKLAMAAALIPYEKPESLFPHTSPPTWLNLLLERLQAPLKDWKRNKLAIITFNYDRVVEQYLSQAILNRFGITLEESTALIRETVPIVHVYGSLGGLPGFGGENERDYSNVVSAEIIRAAANGIRIVHEGDSSVEEFRYAKALLFASRSVVFLGFGYHRANMDRLGVGDLPGTISVQGTSVGLTATERMVARERSNNRIMIDENSYPPTDYFRNNRILGF